MKLIFLDIDGVLNHTSMTKENRIRTVHGDLCRNSILLLNKLTDATDANIVVSSTWRILVEPNTLFSALKNAGITGNFIDVTPRGCSSCLRGNEIARWMNSNAHRFTLPITRPIHDYPYYVILDDDSDMLYWQRNNFICVDYSVGITEKTVYKATQILNRDKL